MARSPTSRFSDSSKSRPALIDAVKTPLGFIVLALLVSEALIAGLSAATPDHRFEIFIGAMVCILCFVLAVVTLALLNLDALLGVKPMVDHAPRFAADLYAGLDGALRNLKSPERLEAWATISDVFLAHEKPLDSYGEFCCGVGKKVQSLAKLTDRKVETLGPIPNQPGQD